MKSSTYVVIKLWVVIMKTETESEEDSDNSTDGK
jgi:hypothetical protein